MPATRTKTAIVTGASSGIGRETARGLAVHGMRVILLGRHHGRLDETLQDIRRSTGNAQLEIEVADLSSQRQVRLAAERLRQRHPGIDVLVNNAGIITKTRTLTEDGIETQFAVNHLAPFLLTHLLMDQLRTAGPARIVNVASAVESLGRIDFSDLGGERHYDSNAAYCQSKLANVLFTFELAARLRGTGVTANCLHPGAIATGLLAEYFGRPRSWATLARVRYPGPAAGAKTSVYLATSPDVAAVSGRYFDDCQRRDTSPASHDAQTRIRLWDVSEQMVHLADHERLAPAH